MSTVGKYWGFQLHPETDQHRYFRNSVIRPSQDRNTTHITSPITFSGISAQLRFRIVPILPEFAGFIDICTAHYFPCFPVSLRLLANECLSLCSFPNRIHFPDDLHGTSFGNTVRTGASFLRLTSWYVTVSIVRVSVLMYGITSS